MRVGDYVRTKQGISKITTIEDEYIRKIVYTDTNECFEYYLDEKGNEIKDYWEKYSSNIIDLIEVGDYVNGIRVDEIKNGQLRTSSYYDGYICHLCNENEIKSIVTKEVYDSVKYSVETD